MVHVPQFIAFMDLPLGFTSEQVVEAKHACYDAFSQRHRTSSEMPSTYLQRLLQLVMYSIHAFYASIAMYGIAPYCFPFGVWDGLRMGATG